MLLPCNSCQTLNPPKACFCTNCGVVLKTTGSSFVSTESRTANIGQGKLSETPDCSVAETAATPGSVANSVARSLLVEAKVDYPATKTFLHSSNNGAAASPSATFDPVYSKQTSNASQSRVADQPSSALDKGGITAVGVEVSLAVSFNFNRIFVKGNPSTAEVRLENLSSLSVERVVLELHSSGLERPLTIKVPRIAPGQSVRRLLEIEPQRAGNMVLNITVQHQSDGETFNLRGETPLRVLQEPSQQNNISIVVQDILNNSGTNAGLGADTGNVQISNLIGAGVIKDLNSLLDHTFDENFCPVALEFDYSLSSRDLPRMAFSLRIPARFLPGVQSARTLWLIPANKDALGLRLVAGERFTLGRSRADVDFLTWFWPRSTHNDEATRHLSKVHVIASARGGKLWLVDPGSSNGSRLDGERLPATGGLTFVERALLRLGDDYELEVWHVESATGGAPNVVNSSRWPGPMTRDLPSPIGAVRFTARNSEAAQWNAVWLLSDASFGRSRSNPVVLDLTGLAEVQGRFHHWRGSFWIEQAQANGAVSVDGQALAAGEIVPLVAGQSLRLGSTDYKVELGA